MKISKATKFNLPLISLLGLFLLLITGKEIGSIVTGPSTYYVDNNATSCSTPSDNDYNPTTRSCGSGSYIVYNTIQGAANVVSAGDVIDVRAGTYTSALIRDKHGTSNSWITFQAHTGETVTIDPYRDNYRVDNAFRFEGSSYIDVKGFLITDTNPYRGSKIYSEYSTGLGKDGIKITSSSSHIRIENNEVRYSPNMGILISPDNNYCEITNNSIHDVGWSKRGYGIYNEAEYTQIRGNIIANSYGYGIHTYSDTGAPSNCVFEKNSVHGNGHNDYGKGYDGFPSGGETRGDGIILGGGAANTVIRNNIVYNNLTSGIRLISSSNTSVFNNTVYHNTGVGINVGAYVSATIENNISYLNSGGNLLIGSGNTTKYNLSNDPKFVDAANGDFHLSSNSSAIDSGAVVPVKDDYEGNARPYNGAYDIGAYEAGGVSGDTIPPAPPAAIDVK